MLHKGFPLSGSSSAPLALPGAIGFTIFFLLSWRHGQVVVECERCNLIFETSSVLHVSWIWTTSPIAARLVPQPMLFSSTQPASTEFWSCYSPVLRCRPGLLLHRRLWQLPHYKEKDIWCHL